MKWYDRDSQAPASPVAVASKLRLLLAKRHRELLFVTGVLSITKVILFLTGGSNSASSGQRITLIGLLPWVLDYFVFPGCLLATLYINRSVLLAASVRLIGEFRRAARTLVIYFVFGFLEFGPLLVTVEGIKRILVSAQVRERGDLLFNRIAFLGGAAIVRFVFLFSFPLLVFKSVAILEDVRQSLKLFNRHKASLLPLLGFSLLISGAPLPESLHFISRPEHLLMMDFVREIVLILFYVLSMDYYTLVEGVDKFARGTSLELSA
jgi:hypothetical protein